DAEAVHYLGSSESYGRSLACIALAATGRTVPAAMAMARRHGVSRRIEMLKLGVGRSRLRTRRAAAVITVVGCLVLAFAATGIGPSKAGEEESPKVPATESSVTEGSAVPKKIVRIVD